MLSELIYVMYSAQFKVYGNTIVLDIMITSTVHGLKISEFVSPVYSARRDRFKLNLIYF